MRTLCATRKLNTFLDRQDGTDQVRETHRVRWVDWLSSTRRALLSVVAADRRGRKTAETKDEAGCTSLVGERGSIGDSKDGSHNWFRDDDDGNAGVHVLYCAVGIILIPFLKKRLLSIPHCARLVLYCDSPESIKVSVPNILVDTYALCQHYLVLYYSPRYIYAHFTAV